MTKQTTSPKKIIIIVTGAEPHYVENALDIIKSKHPKSLIHMFYSNQTSADRKAHIWAYKKADRAEMIPPGTKPTSGGNASLIWAAECTRAGDTSTPLLVLEAPGQDARSSDLLQRATEVFGKDYYHQRIPSAKEEHGNLMAAIVGGSAEALVK